MSTFGVGPSRADRWEVRALSAASLRATVVLAPVMLAAGVGILVGWTVTGVTVLDIVARVVAAGLASVATFVAIEWMARRLLPLAVLLRLSLVFPDHAPSRFSVAMRSTSVRRLREWARSDHDRMGEQALAEKVVTLAAALNFHDRRTRGHSERTRALAELVIDELGLSDAVANEVRWGAFLHDIGKLLVPSAILNKPGSPTPAEWDQLRQHPEEGGRLVRPLRPFIGAGVDAVSCHHESFDGTGYPHGLRGEDIPLTARIVAVVDSFEVMTAVRSYKRPMPVAVARSELVREAGRQFDPQVVRAFVNVSLGRLHWALGLVAWAAELPFIGVVPRAAAQVGAAMGASGSAVSTATLASVATASLGAGLVVSPLAATLPVAASAPAASTSTANAAPAAAVAGTAMIGSRSGGVSSVASATALIPTSGVPQARGGGSTGETNAPASPPAGGATGSGGGRTSSATSETPRAPSTTTPAQPTTASTASGTAHGAVGSTSSSGTHSGTAQGGGTQGGSTTSGGSRTDNQGGTTGNSGLPVVTTVLNVVGGVVGTTLGSLGNLGLGGTGSGGSGSTTQGSSHGILGL